ncbi:hypothetical protein AURDEDRAFT_173356 [Auricularia subglabra TFB-10046 SS5]|nr:hypothetical protein AURDEDRAFT_173356 [Auricularia subglabra TFB-10046 SS5]
MTTSPRSLLEWRELHVVLPARAVWAPFEPFFEQHGYRLFMPVSPYHGYVAAPAGCSPTRAEDEYGRFLPEWMNMVRKHSTFFPQTGLHMAAVSPSNTDVVIRIMAIGDEGQDHLAVMRALAAPEAQVPENHTLPMLAELEKDDIVFGIFPFMWSEAMEEPWFENVRQLLDALEQVLEGLDFMHQRLIAHRDFDFIEVFSNYGCGYDSTKKQPPCYRRPAFFRSVCPDIRYLINDFELSVMFAPDSDPKTRVVTGTPNARYGVPADQYGKWLPPEARLDAPYCPFKADIYQFGQSALNLYNNVQTPPELRALFGQMASDDPDARPTAAEALSALRNIRQNTSEDVLDDIPPHNFLEFRRFAPGETCVCGELTLGARVDVPPPAPMPSKAKKGNLP